MKQDVKGTSAVCLQLFLRAPWLRGAVLVTDTAAPKSLGAPLPTSQRWLRLSFVPSTAEQDRPRSRSVVETSSTTLKQLCALSSSVRGLVLTRTIAKGF